MAKSVITLSYKLEGDAASFKTLTQNADGLKKAMDATVQAAKPLNGRLINFGAITAGFQNCFNAFSQLHDVMEGFANDYAVQETNERKLETVMRQRMGATDQEIQSVKDLASAQQRQGIIGDEVQLAGIQQVATFLKQKSSIDTLLPAMNNLIAQQKGLGASAGDAVTIGNLLGKAMQGNVGALQRVGITFSQAQANVLKYGDESERAAVLAQVITDNVGQMNQQLAQTESGKEKQLANTIGDIKEQIGAAIIPFKSFIEIGAQVGMIAMSFGTLAGGINTVATSVFTGAKAVALFTANIIKNKVAAIAAAAAQKVVAAATTLWQGAQMMLNMVLNANPIGVVIMGITALVSAVILAYQNCESFREVCNKLWQIVKPLGQALMNVLAKALSWVVDKAKAAWTWLKKLLGLGGKKADVTVSVKVPKQAKDPTKAILDKYKNYVPSPKAKKVTAQSARSKVRVATYNANAKDLQGYEDNIDALTKKLNHASVAEASEINKSIEMWQKKADAVRNAGKEIPDDTPKYKEEADTIKDIQANIDILNQKLETATADEAAGLNKTIDLWQKKEETIKNAGREQQGPTFNAGASTLNDIEGNVEYYQNQLSNATIEEAADINQNIKLWQAKADAIRNAGEEAENENGKINKALGESWNGVRSLTSGIEGIGEAAEGSGNAWDKFTRIVDSGIQIFGAIQSVIAIIQAVGIATKATTKATTAQTAAEIANTTAKTAVAASSTAQVTAAVPEIAANKALTQSFVELAASMYMAAHASIPFVGFAIGSGFSAAAVAEVQAIGAMPFAEGGIVSGPTYSLVGEYPGAKNNPEVIAPLDKLRSLMPSAGNGVNINMRVRGRDLVSVASNETRITSKSGRRTNIKP
ncbi:MAG: hypothetical protein LKE41_00990 [Prevotella sp.]|jgi:hypothetical protein|nr:hypothetical protein [Prevotella sp.]